MVSPREDDKKSPESASVYLELTSPHAPWTWWGAAVSHVNEAMAQDGGHDWGHLGRVFMNARNLCDAEAHGQEETWLIVAAAALFHDVVNLPKNSPERHLASTYAAKHANDWLAEHTPLTEAQRQGVHEAIRCHSFSSGFIAESLPAKLVSDADRLDALGAIGIARTFFVGGVLDRPLFHPTDPLAEAREPDDGVWSVDHFFVKLLELPKRMYTEAGLREANARADYMRAFLAALKQEALSGTNGPR
ncbi:MAG: HD domain-containing protein [Myxococcota bacterium]|jgi:uncharacterized protein|nr:HD domain-containing protein [Myxococcota bacterium]